MTREPPLDPYVDPEDILTGQDLIDQVAFYKQTADARGAPYDPEWDHWLELDARGELWVPPSEEDPDTNEVNRPLGPTRWNSERELGEVQLWKLQNRGNPEPYGVAALDRCQLGGTC